MFVEVAGLHAGDEDKIQRAIWDALTREGINYCCHFGQQYGMDAARIDAYS